MKVILVHNYYGSTAPSGENQVFEAERDLLRENGHEVLEFVRHSDEIRSMRYFGTVIGGLSTPWSPWAAAGIRRMVDDFRPDVVHVHNTFPLISPAIFHAIGNRAARVLSLHNYRLFCPAGIPIRAGRVCTECLDTRSVWPALRYGCYRNSRLSTLPLAISVALHRKLGTWTRHVDAYIASTKFQREIMVAAGLPEGSVHVKPYFTGNLKPVPWRDRDNYAVFVGRLSVEKGVKTLLSAWKSVSGLPLKIIGYGPLRRILESQVSAQGINAEFLGEVPRENLLSLVSGAYLQIVPSECYEGFPMVILEAFAGGTPVVASRVGSLSEIVLDGETGLHFKAGDPVDLARRVNSLIERPELAYRMGMKAREIFLEKYTAEKNLDLLIGIYSRARENIEVRRKL